MIVESNKFNAILYFLLGTTITVSFRRWIYGGIIMVLSVCLLGQSQILKSTNPVLRKYQNVTGFIVSSIVVILIGISIYVLSASSILGSQKLFSVFFLALSIGYTAYKRNFQDHPIFEFTITNYISSLLFMITLLTISIIPDNEFIIEKKYKEIKQKFIKAKQPTY